MRDKPKEYSWIMTKFYSAIMLLSNNSFVVETFINKIDTSKRILELGSGTGKDYKVLKKTYNIRGSDYSKAFLHLLEKKFPKDTFLKLNAIEMNTNEKYDVIYSNKVLHHLLPEQLKKSFERQYEVLKEGGVLFHTMWKGEPTNIVKKGMVDIAYDKADIERLKGQFKIKDFIVYKELKDGDSFIVILEK